MRTCDLLLENAAQVVTVDDGRPGPKRGERAMNELGVIERGAVAVEGGTVVGVGSGASMRRRWRPKARLDVEGRTVLPGFVDAHTHPVFARMREDEFARRCRGEDYEQILAAGGGILASARALVKSSPARLAAQVAARFERMLLHGTTTVEAKTGYGLTDEGEKLSLVALQRAAAAAGNRIVPTYMGAHALPDAFRKRRRAYVDQVIDEMIPHAASGGFVRFFDVFVERGAFTAAEGRRMCRAARAHGLRVKVHADEFRDGGGARLAAEVGATSAEHLGGTGAAGIRALARAGVVPVLLPATSLFLRLPRRPDARAMIAAGCPVALATDFNPGSSPTENLSLVAALGCLTLSMTPEEVVVAVTRNAAAAVGEEERAGRIAPGRPADLVVLDAPSYEFLPYRLGTNLVHTVLVGGKVVVANARRVGG
jgi:imidazolonepropionase